MKIKEIQKIGSILNRETGWLWPLILLRAVRKKKAIFSHTRWAGKQNPEAAFVRRFASVSSLYLELSNRLGGNHALDVMREIVVSLGCAEQQDHLNSLTKSSCSEMDRLMAFNKRMDQKGAPQFNERRYEKQDATVCHFVITRCVFHDFFTEAGTPELTQLFCEVDHQFFPKAFPDLKFHRNGSWLNTIAHGKDHCEFVFDAIPKTKKIHEQGI